MEEIRFVKYFVNNGRDSNIFKRLKLGPGANKRCGKVTCDEIEECIKKAADKWKGKKWALWRNCRSFINQIREKCCLQ